MKPEDLLNDDFELLTGSLMRSLTKDSLFAEQEAFSNYLLKQTDTIEQHRRLAVRHHCRRSSR